MNYCKPYKKKNKIICYSKKSLIKMTDAWNKKHNDKLQEHLSSDELWYNLNNKLSNHCDSEWCWKNLEFIKNLNDKEINNTLDLKMPEEWYNNLMLGYQP